MAKKPTKKKATKNKGGRPSAYDPKFATIAKFLCDRGADDKEIAACLGVSVASINNWKKIHPEFLESLKRGKKYFDKKVEIALAERATGYSHDDVHISNYKGEVTVTEITKHYPPDTTACIYWLNNRKRKKWASRKAVESEIKLKEIPDGAGVLELPAPANMEDWLNIASQAEEDLVKKQKEFSKHG